MAGMTFYWLSWVLWTITTFFMDKSNNLRCRFSVFLLFGIILSPYHFQILGIPVYVITIFYLIVTYYYLAKERFRTILLLSFYSLIISIIYVSFIIFTYIDPVLLIFNQYWMMACFISILAIFLHSSFIHRLLIVLAGVIHGEIVTAFLFNHLYLPYAVGSHAFLDTVAKTLILLFVWAMFENANVIFDKYFTLIERGKRKQL